LYVHIIRVHNPLTYIVRIVVVGIVVVGLVIIGIVFVGAVIDGAVVVRTVVIGVGKLEIMDAITNRFIVAHLGLVLEVKRK
jgi:hypothetical protein